MLSLGARSEPSGVQCHMPGYLFGEWDLDTLIGFDDRT